MPPSRIFVVRWDSLDSFPSFSNFWLTKLPACHSGPCLKEERNKEKHDLFKTLRTVWFKHTVDSEHPRALDESCSISTNFCNFCNFSHQIYCVRCMYNMYVSRRNFTLDCIDNSNCKNQFMQFLQRTSRGQRVVGWLAVCARTKQSKFVDRSTVRACMCMARWMGGWMDGWKKGWRDASTCHLSARTVLRGIWRVAEWQMCMYLHTYYFTFHVWIHSFCARFQIVRSDGGCLREYNGTSRRRSRQRGGTVNKTSC